MLPTEYEIFGMVLLEAMYYSTVVITTENGGAGVLIRNEENGFVLDLVSSDKWAEKIIALSRNVERMQKISDKAHETIAENFTWDHLADIFISEYKKVKGDN